MKSKLKELLSAISVVAALAAAPWVSAQAVPAAPAAGTLVPAASVDATWLAQARAAYPLQTCLVADEPLGSMGKPAEFVHRVEGRPDRLVIFCCGGCRRDFLKDPAAHLAKLDAAAKTKSADDPESSGGQAGAHGHH